MQIYPIMQHFSVQDTLLAWDGIKAKGKGKERHLFLLEKVLIGAKKTEAGGKNKDDFNYNVKFVMKVRCLSCLTSRDNSFRQLGAIYGHE